MAGSVRKENMKISIAVRQKFHGFNLAHQLERLGALQNLYTSYYGKLLGKDNSTGFEIDKKKIKTNLFNAFITYGFKNKYAYSADGYFGNWVASKMGDEDIIVTWGIQALPIIKKAKELGIKVVLERGSSHAVEQRDILMEEFKQWGLNTYELEKSFSKRRMERELMEYEMADMISVPSGFVEKSFIKHGIGAEKLFVNAYGADLGSFRKESIEHDNFRIINAGTQSIRKGAHYLLRAFYELNLPNAELWLVGNIESNIYPFIKKYQHPKIKFYNAVPQNQLADYYNQCDVFVLASIEEGLAMVQLQAMACGLPIICTSNTGGEDLIGNNNEAGFVLPIKNIELLKEKILFLNHNNDVCKQMGLNALNKIKSGYSWNDYGNRALSFYNTLMK
jgi:glycosyltransferase involved in cell wall biosynthesis